MNKGRNFFILMSCLLLLGLLTFLTRTKLENRSGVVDNVRYILKSSVNNVKNYEFYFTDDMVMTGTLENADGSYTLHLYVREAYDETLQDYLTQPYAYYYTVSGSQKSNAAVEWHYEEDAEEAQKTGEPYERFTERVFISMIYGTDSIITIWQAIAVAIIAVTGCYAQLRPQEIAAIEGVDIVLSNNDKGALFKRVVELSGKGRAQVYSC